MTSHDTLRNRKRIFSDDVVVLVEEEQPDGVISTNMKRDTNLNTLDAATRDWHIELLSGLFLRSTEQELNYLESEVASNERVDSPSATSEVNSAPKNLYSEHTACPGGAVEHSVLPLISSALLEICPQKKADQDEFDRPLLIPESWRRPSYQSLTLLELEQKINNSKSDSADKDDVIHKGDSHAKRRKTSNDDKQQNSNEGSCKLMMPILYNECSLSAFANWAMMDPPDSFENAVEVTPGHSPQHEWDEYSREMTHQMATNCTTYEVPVLPRTYRKCGVCSNFGHYEVECDLLLDRDDKLQLTELTSNMQSYLDENRRVSIISELSKEIRVQRLQRNIMEEPDEENEAGDPETDFDDDDNDFVGSCCKICKSGLNDEMLVCDGCEHLFHPKCLDPPMNAPYPEGEWLCDSCLHYDSDQSSTVAIEGCGDFIVEQRKRSLAESSKHFGGISLGQHQCQWTAALSLMEESLPVIDNDYLESHILDGYNTPKLVPGKLCWAKQFGQNNFDWWPAMILEPKAPSVYTVRFFGLNKKKNLLAANENVLPYLPYYEDIGFKRVSAEACVHSEFCDAIQLSLKALGLKTFAQALVIARNGVQKSLCTDPLNNKAVGERTRRPSGSWEHAEIDDFVILSKEMETIEPSPSKNDLMADTPVESVGSLNEPIQYQSNIRHDFYLEEVVGGIVSWSVQQDGAKLDDGPQYGCVLSINPANETALVRSIKIDETLDDHIQSNDTVIQTQNVGSTMWMPLYALRFVSSKPSSSSLVELKATLKSRMNNEISFHKDRCEADAICREENTVEL